MSVVSRATLKGYFNTGDTPTEAQFANLIDTTILAEDSFIPGKIYTANVTSGGGSITIPAGSLISHISIAAEGTGTVDIGTSAAGTQLAEDEPYIVGGTVIALNRYSLSAQTIHFTPTGTVQVYIVAIIIGVPF
jgi:hypothetical protein